MADPVPIQGLYPEFLGAGMCPWSTGAVLAFGSMGTSRTLGSARLGLGSGSAGVALNPMSTKACGHGPGMQTGACLNLGRDLG